MTDVAYQIEKLEEKAANLKNAVSKTTSHILRMPNPQSALEKISGSPQEIRGGDSAQA